MSNKFYERGKNKEGRVKRKLQLQGYIVLRTAGSHGFADLIAIDKDLKVIRFIQCKPRNFSDSEKEKLMSESDFCNNDYKCSFEII